MKNTKAKFCFNTMVNNEAHVIERMLNSVYPYIDYYVIQDNGSTDGTPDIIRNFFKEKGIDGFVYEIDWWKGHGINRDHTLQTALSADHGCDWILRVDADEQLNVDENFDWSVFDNTSIQSWNVPCQGPGIMYFRTWIWNAKLPWRFYPEKAHETIYLDSNNIGEDFQRVNLDTGFRHILTNDGQTWLKPMKFLKDALNLELDTIPTKKVLEDEYHLWYIAKSYHDTLGDDFPFGDDHRKEYARRAIFYWSKWIENFASPIDEFAYWAHLGIGNCYNKIGDEENTIKHWNAATKYCPDRNEHYYSLAYLHQKNKDWFWMHEATKKLVDTNRKNPFPRFQFMIQNDSYYDTSEIPQQLHKIALQGLNG